MKPHINVYTRLGISKVCKGIGVFAIIDIKKGTDIFKMDRNTETTEVSAKEINKLPQSIKKMYHDFCPLNDGIYTCPKSFAMLTPSWYLNHSKDGNVYIDKYLNFIANKRIKAGEEILANYETYSDKPPGGFF